MTDHVPFLQAIVAEADADLPRLIYADWLEEQGETPRAEFIRVQCDLARLPRLDPGWRALAERELDLLNAHGAAWRAEVPTFPGIVWQDFERGFLSIVQVTGYEQFVKAAPSLFECAPVQTAHFVEFAGRDLERLAAVPELRHLRRLSLWRGAALRGTQKLLASEHLHFLRVLTIWSARLDDRAVESLCRAEVLPSLGMLDLSENLIGNKGVQALLSAPVCLGLRELLLSRNRISAVGALALARSSQLEQLAFLDLRYNDIVDPARALLRERFGDRVLV